MIVARRSLLVAILAAAAPPAIVRAASLMKGRPESMERALTFNNEWFVVWQVTGGHDEVPAAEFHEIVVSGRELA
jgi:hypothetical protein